MKESSTEPPKKKLKQARLPFQILSPGIKNCEVTSTTPCKRKASENDDDVVVCEIDEELVTPLEKKPKVAKKDKDNDLKNHGNETEDELPEVEEKESDTKIVTAKENNKTHSNKSKRITKTASSQKTSIKNTNKPVAKRNEQTEKNGAKSKTEVIDCIDLCNSPSKNSNPDETKSATVARYNGELSSVKINRNQSEGGSENKKISHVSINKREENDKLEENNEEEKNCDDSLQVKNVSEKKLSKNGPEEELQNSETTAESIRTQNSKLCSSSEKSEEQLESGKCDFNNSPKTSVVKGNRKSVSKKTPTSKNSSKQASLKDLVTNKSSEKKNENKSLSIESKEDKCDKKSDKDTNVKEAQDLNSTPVKSSQCILDESNLKTPSASDESSSKINESGTSDCDTSTLSTPSTSGVDSAKKLIITPKRLTPKQMMKLKEKEAKRKEREKLKQEKEKKKAEEKEEKLRIKKEKEEEKVRLKKEKEEEKRKEKEEKEKKRLAELEQKNEEKRLKEEEKRQKEEEKRAKEEEERKKKEEKRLKEEQKEAEKRKSAQAFASFFVKPETKPTSVEDDKENFPTESIFQPFEVKNDMRLAPILRAQLNQDRKQFLDSVLEPDTANTAPKLYLEELHSPNYMKGSASRTWPPPDEIDDEVIIIESEKPNELMELDNSEAEKKPEKKRRRAKLLQFHENRRPPYWGTWRKKSKYIRPCAPLNQDKTMFEYEVDSDDEWEEPEDGESLRGSEDEESQDEQYEEDNDMFVPHGYLSDGEGEDEFDDQSPEAMKAKLKLLQLEFEAERSEKQQKLKPRLIGCVWFCNFDSDPSAVGSQISELFLSRRAVWEGDLPITVAVPLPSSPTVSVTLTTAETPGEKSKPGKKRQLVPESMVTDIIRKIHGSRKKVSKLMLEILDEQKESEVRPSKNCLAKRIRELATWEVCQETGRHCWYVKEDIRRAYGLTDLNIQVEESPAPASPAVNITKFTKVLTADERLKLLRESPSSKDGKEAKESCKPAVESKPMTPSQNAKTPNIKFASSTPVKKRVSLISVGPGQALPKQSPSSIMNFVNKNAKPEEKATKSIIEQKQPNTGKSEEKVKKRITPITLTNTVSKSAPITDSETNCIVIDD